MKYFTKLPIIFDELKLVEALRQVEEIAPWPEQSIHKEISSDLFDKERRSNSTRMFL